MRLCDHQRCMGACDQTQHWAVTWLNGHSKPAREREERERGDCGLRLCRPRSTQTLLLAEKSTWRQIIVKCGKIFQNRYYLQSHIKVHSEASDHACSICGKTFRQRRDLKRHQAVHCEERKYPCLACDKTFKQSRTLEAHAHRHTKSEDYQEMQRESLPSGDYSLFAGEKGAQCPDSREKKKKN